MNSNYMNKNDYKELNNNSNNYINYKNTDSNLSSADIIKSKKSPIYIKKNNLFLKNDNRNIKKNINKKFKDIESNISCINNNTNYTYSINADNFSNFSQDINILKTQYSKSNRVLNDFKKILNQTMTLRNKIIDKSYDLENNLNCPSINYYYNNAKETLDNLNGKKKISNNLNNNISEEDDPFGFNEFLKDDNSYNYIKITKNKNNLNIIPNNIEKIKILNQNISNLNSNLVIENRALESEINMHKSKDIFNPFEQKQPFNSFDTSLKKFIKNLKTSLQKNINENMTLAKDIFNAQIELQICFQKNMRQINLYEKLVNKIQNQNKKISNIQNYNIENSKRCNNLLDEKNILNDKLETLKINLINLKSKEKTLSLKHESNLKSKQDSEDLIIKLYKTIKNLNNENIHIDKKQENNNGNSLSILDEKINQLYSILNGLEKEKKIILEQNKKINKEIENKKNLEKNNIKINELKSELNDLKSQKENIIKNIQEKEKEIKLLKENVDKLSNGLDNNNSINKKIKLIVEKKDSEETKIKNIIEENRLEEEIKKTINLNIAKDNEIQSSSKTYDNIITQKEKEILFLETQLTQNDSTSKKNSNNNDNKRSIYLKRNIFNDKNFDYLRTDIDTNKDEDKNTIDNNKINNQIEENKNDKNNKDNNENNENKTSNYDYFENEGNEEEEVEYYDGNSNGKENFDYEEEYYYENLEDQNVNNINNNIEYEEIEKNNNEIKKYKDSDNQNNEE